MIRIIFTYLFIAVLFTAVVLPTYLSLTKSCEVSLCLNDIEEDFEGEETENVKDLEIKLLFTNLLTTSYKQTEILQKVTYLSKEYTSIYGKLESPPPKNIQYT